MLEWLSLDFGTFTSHTDPQIMCISIQHVHDCSPLPIFQLTQYVNNYIDLTNSDITWLVYCTCTCTCMQMRMCACIHAHTHTHTHAHTHTEPKREREGHSHTRFQPHKTVAAVQLPFLLQPHPIKLSNTPVHYRMKEVQRQADRWNTLPCMLLRQYVSKSHSDSQIIIVPWSGPLCQAQSEVMHSVKFCT